MSSNAADDEVRDDNAPQADGGKSSSTNWLGRWVLMAAILAFLVVYVAQLYRGSSLFYTILISTAAMGVVGVGGMVARQIILRAASTDRAAGILDQMRQVHDARTDETRESEDE